MSSVRMCDKCGEIFSENTDGWDTLTGTKRVRDDRGVVSVVSVSMDVCADCSITGAPDPVRKQISQAVAMEAKHRV